MKDSSDFESGVLAEKKRRLVKAVSEASKSLGVSFPINVSITEEPCPQYSGDEKAHIHVEEGVICVWEKDLTQMDFEEIKEIAAHEVAHLRSKKHGTEHKRTTTEIQTKTWKPPSGVLWEVPGRGTKKIERKEIPLSKRLENFTVKELQQLARDKDLSSYSNLRKSELIEMIDGSVEKSELKEKILEFSCSYHLCEETDMDLEECGYCGKTFCQEHIKACLPSLPPFKDSEVDREEWAGDGHPCPEYPKHMKNKEKEELEARKEALDELSGRKTTEITMKGKSKNKILIGIAIIIAVLVIFLLYYLDVFTI